MVLADDYIWFKPRYEGKTQAGFNADDTMCKQFIDERVPKLDPYRETMETLQRNLGCMPPYCAPAPQKFYGPLDIAQNKQQRQKLYTACMYERGWEINSE